MIVIQVKVRAYYSRQVNNNVMKKFSPVSSPYLEAADAPDSYNLNHKMQPLTATHGFSHKIHVRTQNIYICTIASIHFYDTHVHVPLTHIHAR